VLLDVTLPLLLGRRADRSARSDREVLQRPKRDFSAQLLNLCRLRAKLTALAAGYRPAGTWADYTSTCNYSDRSEEAKKDLVRRYLQSVRPPWVLDAGCNTGDYSYLAAESGARVIAADADHDAVELLYRRLRRQPAAITPLVLELTNPRPAIGFRNRERPSFLERVQAPCVLALALLHHLVVTANLSLAAVRAFLADLTGDSLVLEFVPPEDSMFQRLLKFRLDRFEDSPSTPAAKSSAIASRSSASRSPVRRGRCSSCEKGWMKGFIC
jgi:SAM-dependent methyltransferase